MIKELVVAEKEFKEYLTGKRFLAILAILLVLCVIGMISGVQSYNTQIKEYKATQEQQKTDLGYRIQAQENAKMLANATAGGASQGQPVMTPSAMLSMQYPMPSLITIFYSISSSFVMIGTLLAIAVGFDLISKEKEEGSLKSLLSHPIFRDSVINGKAIAAIVLLVVAIAVTFLVIIAFLLLNSIVPTGDDLMRIAAFFGVTLLYCVAFLGISIMVSTLVKNSTMSILIILGIFMIAYSVPNVSYSISGAILGPMPEYPLTPGYINLQPNETVTIDGQTITFEEAQQINMKNQQQNQLKQQQAQNDMNAYMKKQQDLTSLINTLSPVGSYQELSTATINDQKPWDPTETSSTGLWTQEKITLWQSLGYKLGDLIVLLLIAIVSFAVSYVAFMRTDIR